MSNVPAIIHMMYFPWGKDQKLLPDPDAFDHRPYENMVKYAPDFEVKLWNYSATESFCQQHYPEIWQVAKSLPRPMMLVNTLRWLVVYHWGGISWQYDMNPLVPMESILPSPGKEARVFTEFELTPEQCWLKAHEPIRQGRPEESVRIPSQAFAAIPRHRYIKAVVEFIHERSKTFVFKRDYDCQFITGNAAASTAFDLFGKDDPTVERVGLLETRQKMKFIYLGTWRTETGASPDAASRKTATPKIALGERMALLLRKWELGRSVYHSCIHPDSYETAFAELHRKKPEIMEVNGSVSQAVGEMIVAAGAASVLNFPASHLPALGDNLPGTVRYAARDVARSGGTGRYANLLYSRLPRVDLVVMRNFLDHVGNEDAIHMIARLKQAGVQYLLSTHYPCLNKNWQNYTGEWRPVNLALKPFCLVPATGWIPDPDPLRRPDRGLGLFRL